MTTTSSAKPARKTADRRTLLRLRDLCDEVLASYRVANEKDVISSRDRDEARQMMARLGFAR